MTTNRLAQAYSFISLLCICVIGLFTLAFGSVKVLSQIDMLVAEPHIQIEESNTPDYKMRRFFTPADKEHFTIILVTLPPKNFNRQDMTALAVHLNREFAQTTKLKAALLDDDNLVQQFVRGGVELPDFDKAQRGLYYLDRTKCKEYIRFFVRKGEPGNETTLRFKCSRSRQ